MVDEPIPVTVVFRKWPDGEVIALFPEIPEDRWGDTCGSYMHNGQHGGASCSPVIEDTKPASPRDYAPLLRELVRIGYDPVVKPRVTPTMNRRRKLEARRA